MFSTVELVDYKLFETVRLLLICGESTGMKWRGLVTRKNVNGKYKSISDLPNLKDGKILCVQSSVVRFIIVD